MPTLSKPPDIHLTPLEEALIKCVHSRYARINLEREFGGGYSGTRVFLILPVNPDGAADARVVTKTGPADALRAERDNYRAHVANALPFTAARVDEFCEQEGQAALNYVFAGDETLGKTVSLEDYYHSHTAQEVITTLTGLLDQALGPRWYRQSHPLNHSFRDEYGRHLPENLGAIVAAVFPNLPLTEGDRVKIPGVVGTYPDPLKMYPGLLDKPLEGRRSLVHGDLHLRNVLVDQSGKGWLIDFAKVRERHNLFDFIKLETYLRLMGLADEYGAFSWSEYAQFEQALNAAAMDGNATPPTDPSLAKAYEVIQAIRKIARSCMREPQNFNGEYLTPLFLYCLAMMKYYQSNRPMSTQLVFITACVVGLLLESETLAPRTSQQKTLLNYLNAVRKQCVDIFSTELVRPDRVYIPQFAATDTEHEVNLLDATTLFWAGKHRRIAVLGNYGMGKTYHAWRTILDQISQCEQKVEQKIPILYPLKKFSYTEAAGQEGHKRNLLRQILDHAILLDFPKIEEKEFVRWMEDGVVGIILDGLDELPALPRNKSWRDILAPVSEIDGVHLLLTSRTSYVLNPQRDLDGYTVYELLPWGAREWSQYLDRATDALKTVGGKDGLLNALSDKPKVSSLTTRPLWCFMIVAISEKLPGLGDLTLSGLYQEFLDTAIKRRPLTDSILPLSWQYYAMERFAEECIRTKEPSLGELHLLTMLSYVFESIGSEQLREYLINQVRTYAFLNCDQFRRYNFGHQSFEDYFVVTGSIRWLAEQATGYRSGPLQHIPYDPLLSLQALSNEQVILLVGILYEEWIQKSLEIIPSADGKSIQTRVLLFLQRELSTDQRSQQLKVNMFRIYIEMLRAASKEQHVSITGLSLKQLNLANMNLTNCIFQKVDFTSAVLSNTCFANSSFAGCVFSGAAIDGTDFTGADLTGADFRGVERPMQQPIFKNATGIQHTMTRAREQRFLFH